jgi:colanic acid/amylovoran biosynthesis glycosyltransferase
MNNNKTLIFLTSSYPLANGELFIENEIKFIENHFDKIIIICSSISEKPLNWHVPKNADAIYFNSNSISFFQKVISLKFIFTLFFWKEILFTRKKLNIKTITSIAKTLLIEIHKAKKSSKFIKEKLSTLNSDQQFYFYSYWLNYNAIALSFLKQSHIKGKFFSRAHGWDLYDERSECHYLPLRNFIYRNLDAIFPISINGFNYINATYINKGDQTGAAVIISKLGTNYHGLNPENHRNNELTLVSCSMIYPNKQVDLIAKTLVNLKNNQKIRWVHFGSFIPNTSEKHYEELLKIINNNQNTHLQVDLMGFADNAEIMKFYLNNPVDVFINLSLSEGIPVSIMEAMSFGIPIIATAVGGTPEIVKDGFNGFLLSPNPTIEEVDHTITKFCNLSDKDKFTMRQNSFNLWNTDYNAEKNYTEFAEKILTI